MVFKNKYAGLCSIPQRRKCNLRRYVNCMTSFSLTNVESKKLGLFKTFFQISLMKGTCTVGGRVGLGHPLDPPLRCEPYEKVLEDIKYQYDLCQGMK